MLTLKRLRAERDLVVERLQIKGFDAANIVDRVLALDSQRRGCQVALEESQRQLNEVSKSIGQLMQQGAKEEAQAKRQEVAQLKERLKEQAAQEAALGQELDAQLVLLPNVPHVSVPKGTTAEDNMVVRMDGEMPTLPSGALPHWELASRLGLIDFELGVKLTGSGFPLFIDAGARLERGLISFFLDENAKAGYREVLPPIMVNATSAYATGQLPDKEGQMYYVPQDDLYLVPTAEVPLTNMLRDTILDPEQLPLKLTAYTPCFRREAGSYGKDVRGLNRLHQFDKVEIVCIEHPERSYDRLEEMVQHVEGLLQKLELPYRVLRLCGGDMSFTSALTYDLEVYSAGQDRWLEVSSVSNFEDFQSNRLSLRYRDTEQKRTALAHTLNGSSLALPRIVAALLENNQTSYGVHVPDLLQPFVGVEELRWKK